MSWNRILDKSKALEASERSISASILEMLCFKPGSSKGLMDDYSGSKALKAPGTVAALISLHHAENQCMSERGRKIDTKLL